MNTASNNSLQNKKPSRSTAINWGGLLGLIADDLAVCSEVLNVRRLKILEVRERHFSPNWPFVEPSEDGLWEFAIQSSYLQGSLQFVRNRLDQIKPKLLNDLAGDAIKYKEVSPLDLDEVNFGL